MTSTHKCPRKRALAKENIQRDRRNTAIESSGQGGLAATHLDQDADIPGRWRFVIFAAGSWHGPGAHTPADSIAVTAVSSGGVSSLPVRLHEEAAVWVLTLH
ncbi:hypothetical protein E5D57_005668 [Metarhizium anisopliae]|nr:hypothetical protein E5D57_005668 [Metarhizium anisopliae]